MPDQPKPLDWTGTSLADARALPDGARQEVGYQLGRVQEGRTPEDFKPMKTVGPGVFEVRVRDDGRAFRSFYVARFEEAVYVLHVFEKKSQRTAQADVDLGRTRYRALVRQRAEQSPRG